MAAAASGQLLGVGLPAAHGPVAEHEPASWPPLPEPQAKVAASAGVVKEVVVSGISVSIANTATNPLGARGWLLAGPQCGFDGVDNARADSAGVLCAR
jgi:hypothetical protein